jgi:hypothetical protein
MLTLIAVLLRALAWLHTSGTCADVQHPMPGRVDAGLRRSRECLCLQDPLILHGLG